MPPENELSQTSIEGTWHPIRAEHEGQLAPEMALMKMKMIFERGKYCLRFGHEPSDEGTYEIITAEAETVLKLRGTKGVNSGRTIPAIFQLRGDRLRVCYGMNGVCPKDFNAGLNSARYLVTYKRSGV